MASPAPAKADSEYIEADPKNEDYSRPGMDRAAKYLQDANKVVVVAEENNKRVLRRIDLTILPILAEYLRTPEPRQNDSLICLRVQVDRGYEPQRRGVIWLGAIVYLAQLVPVFSSDYDSFNSIRQSSSFLLDTIVAFGYKVCIGNEHQGLFLHLRRRISDSLMLSLPSTSLETLQALLILVCYWEHSWIFMGLALSMARDLNFPEAVEDSMTVISAANMIGSAAAAKELYFVEGGKVATIFRLDKPRRIRCLVNHPDRSAIDIRLFAQVELNQIRSSVHFDLPSGQNLLDISETDITRSLRNARIDLDLWLADWTHIIEMDNRTRLDDREENAVNQQNLKIQYKWAWASVNLRALSYMGAENLATMKPMQRQVIESAKLAAEEHLGLLLNGSESIPPESISRENISPYLASFKWATKFVWAKCAFSILFTLRLAFLLENAFDHLIQLGLQAMNDAKQLKAVCGGQSEYFQVLENSVSKFQKAVRDRRRGAEGFQSRQQSSSNDAEAEFRRYLPKEFSFVLELSGTGFAVHPD